MANNHGETPADDFLEQILGFPRYTGEANLTGNENAMMLHLGSGSSHMGAFGSATGFPLGLSLEQGKTAFGDAMGSEKRRYNRNEASSSIKSGYQMVNTNTNTAAHPPVVRPRVRARRGQATDPHSIAERLRRERIAERMRALQELVPSVNKTDRAAMLDEVVDYVKFLRLQVKVLSMSRLGGAGAVAPLVTDVPISSVTEEGGDGGRAQPAWEKWSNDGTEKQVAKLMEENVGSAMQFLQSKALCIMPVSLASAIYNTQQPETFGLVKPECEPGS